MKTIMMLMSLTDASDDYDYLRWGRKTFQMMVISFVVNLGELSGHDDEEFRDGHH